MKQRINNIIGIAVLVGYGVCITRWFWYTMVISAVVVGIRKKLKG